jgi:hypothetical protein
VVHLWSCYSQETLICLGSAVNLWSCYTQ